MCPSLTHCVLSLPRPLILSVSLRAVPPPFSPLVPPHAADFFVLKLLGRPASLDELPSLDAELATSLDFLKRYDGDVEGDLCLTFSVDREEFGKRTTVDLRDGGRVVAVTKDNRIECV